MASHSGAGIAGFTALFCVALLGACTSSGSHIPPELLPKSIYDVEVQTIDGEPLRLDHYRGKVLLIVNTASKCGFTGQYEGLQDLYLKYRDRDFEVLAFPANNFMNQEPGSNKEIQAFCSREFHVTFPLFAKVSVKGDDQHPLYGYLTSEVTNPDFSGGITWNFNKFLIGRDGRILARFGTRTPPEDETVARAIEKALGDS